MNYISEAESELIELVREIGHKKRFRLLDIIRDDNSIEFVLWYNGVNCRKIPGLPIRRMIWNEGIGDYLEVYSHKYKFRINLLDTVLVNPTERLSEMISAGLELLDEYHITLNRFYKRGRE